MYPQISGGDFFIQTYTLMRIKQDFGALFCQIKEDKVDVTYYEMNNIPKTIKEDIIKKYKNTKCKKPAYFVVYDNDNSIIIEYEFDGI